MIEATLIEKASGKPFGHVTVPRVSDLAAYETDEVEVARGGHQELDPPRTDEVEKIRAANEHMDRLERLAWTIRADSPLTPQNRAEWLAWLRAARKAVGNADDPREVKLPPEPAVAFDR